MGSMVDPNIALQYKNPQIDPTKMYSEALGIVNEQNRGQLQQQALQAGALENQQRQRSLDQQKAVDDAYRDALTPQPDGSVAIDSSKLTHALSLNGHGSVIPSILEANNKYQKSTADLQEAQAKVTIARADNAGAMAAAIKQAGGDPMLAQTLITHAAANKSIDPQVAQSLLGKIQQAQAQDPSGEAARALINSTADQLIAASPGQRKIAAEETTAKARADTAKTSADKAAVELPGLQATAEEKVRQNTAARLASAPDQKTYDTLRGELPKKIADQFPDVYDPDKIRRVGMTPDQVVDNDRQAATAKQTKAHEDAMERNAAAHLSVEQQGLDLRKANAGTGGGVQGRFNDRQLAAAQKQMDVWQAQEQDQHSLRSSIGSILSTKDGETFVDPKTHQEIEMTPAQRTYWKDQLGKATSKASVLASQQKDMRKKFGLGEFAQGGDEEGSSDDTPAAPPPAATPPPATKQTPNQGPAPKRIYINPQTNERVWWNGKAWVKP